MATLAVMAGMADPTASVSERLLPVAVGVGLLLAVLAWRDFWTWLLCLLVVRTAVDVAKGTGSSTGLTDPTTLVALTVLFGGGLWLVRRGHRVPGVSRSPLRLGVLTLLATSLVSAATSLAPGQSAREILRLLTLLMLVLLLDRLLEDRTRLRPLVIALFLSSMIPVVFGIFGAVQNRVGPFMELKGGDLRLSSTFDQSNTFARYLVLMVLLATAVALLGDRPWRRWSMLLLALYLPLLFLTHTRGAWVGLLVGWVVLGLIHRRRATLLALATAGTVVLVTLPTVVGLLDFSGDPRAAGPVTSVEWRLTYWGDALPLVAQNPISGVGLDATPGLMPQGQELHNDFLRMLVEGGLLGLVGYLALVVGLAATAARAVRHARDPIARVVALACAGAVAAFVVTSAAANVVSSLSFMWYLVSLAAAAEAVGRHPTAAPRPHAVARTGA